MPADKFLISYLDENTGQQNNLRPWLIFDNAYANMENAYSFRGRIKKRFGSRYLPSTSSLTNRDQTLSRLRMLLGTTGGTGTDMYVVPPASGAIGQMFSVGSVSGAITILTCNVLGTPATLLTTSGSISGTFNTTTGDVVISGAPAGLTVWFYPAYPVMGLPTQEEPGTNFEATIAFDTRYAYEYAAGWTRIAGGVSTWTGTDSDFFWTTNYRGALSSQSFLFVVNNVPADGLRYLSGATWVQVNTQLSIADPTYVVNTAAIVIAFKGRLVLLNTVETSAAGSQLRYVNRARYCQAGNPIETSGGNGLAWREDLQGRGGWIDAPTKEAIVSAALIRDRVIVGFERSTWELVYTNNQAAPFLWQQINSEFGAESRFSAIRFDQSLITVGQTAITLCTGANVERIDNKIPDAIWSIQNSDEGPERVYGIRDYYTELVYWSFPSPIVTREQHKFPNRVLCYNYKSGAWAFFDDSITCFGYFQSDAGLTWGGATMTWAEADFPWGSPTTIARSLQVIAGNQEGYTFICDSDIPRNVGAFQITDMVPQANGSIVFTVVDHNLDVGDFVLVEYATGTGDIETANTMIFQVSTITDSNTFTAYNNNTPITTGTYQGGGTLAWVSQINLESKQYNFYIKQAKNFTINKIDYQVDNTPNGQMTLYFVPDATNSVSDTRILQMVPFTSFYPREATAARLWRTVYPNVYGEFVQIVMTLSPEQMFDREIALSDFELHSIIYYCSPAGRLQ